MKHGGSGAAYVHNRCRCDDCREANRKRTARRRAERYAAPKSPDDPRHGTFSFYANHGCRCEVCTSAWAAYSQEQYAKRKERRRA